MDTTRFKFTRFERSIFRTPMVVLITALVTAGGTWRVMADSRQGSTTQVTTESPTSHPASVESVHTSYADVVRDVAPAVVTIRTESKAQMTPTAFPDLRRFFDDRFEQMPNQPRTYSQRGLGSGVVVSTRRVHPDQSPCDRRCR